MARRREARARLRAPRARHRIRAVAIASDLVDRVLEAWPGGVDVVRASALDPRALSTLRTVVVVLDAPLDRTVLVQRWGEAAVAAAEREADGRLVLAPLAPFADLASVETLARVAAKLRAPDGCPWDREQTHASLRPFVLEEAYEVLDALDTGDTPALREELGDLLFQVAIHAQLADEAGAFDIGEVARVVNEKLIRRHPHVFAGGAIPDDLWQQWDRIKREEKAANGNDAGVADGVPKALPALAAADALLARSLRAGFTHERVDLPLDVDDAVQLGDLLFDLVALAREMGIDAETALREANARFVSRLRERERA